MLQALGEVSIRLYISSSPNDMPSTHSVLFLEANSKLENLLGFFIESSISIQNHIYPPMFVPVIDSSTP